MSALSHQPPCEADDDSVSCWTCADSGEYVPDSSSLLMPCPDCDRGDWTWREELYDDMRRAGK